MGQLDNVAVFDVWSRILKCKMIQEGTEESADGELGTRGQVGRRSDGSIGVFSRRPYSILPGLTHGATPQTQVITQRRGYKTG
jgi:hypothetical protein